MEAKQPQNTPEWINLGEKILGWAHKGLSIDIDDFAREYGYNPYKLYGWADKNETFREYFQKATYIVGGRRNEALKDKDKLIMRTLHKYDLRLKEIEDEARKEEVVNKAPAWIVTREIPHTKELDEHEKSKESV
jgi:hypothetical protein